MPRTVYEHEVSRFEHDRLREHGACRAGAAFATALGERFTSPSPYSSPIRFPADYAGMTWSPSRSAIVRETFQAGRDTITAKERNMIRNVFFVCGTSALLVLGGCGTSSPGVSPMPS